MLDNFTRQRESPSALSCQNWKNASKTQKRQGLCMDGQTQKKSKTNAFGWA